MIFSEIPKLVINLPARADRRRQILDQLANWAFIFIDGVEHHVPMTGIAEAHKRAAQYALDKGWDHVLIMEDDLVLRKGFEDYLNHALKNTPENWDVLLGGLYMAQYLKPVNQYWNQVGEFCGAHFYIAREKVLQRIINYNPRQHIDRHINKGGKEVNAYVLKKFIATQSNGFSDNVKKLVDYSDKIKRFELL